MQSTIKSTSCHRTKQCDNELDEVRVNLESHLNDGMTVEAPSLEKTLHRTNNRDLVSLNKDFYKIEDELVAVKWDLVAIETVARCREPVAAALEQEEVRLV